MRVSKFFLVLLGAVVPQLLLIQVAAAQTISAIEVVGNKRVESSTVQLQIKSKVGDPFSAELAAADVKNIYRTGFFDQVALAKRNDGSGLVVQFSVVEKPAVRRVKIEGNQEVDSDTIREKLNLGTKLFLDQRKIATGIEEVKRYYQSQGYFGSEITYSTSQVQENQVDLLFTVNDGQKRRLRKVVLEGVKKLDEEDVRGVIETEEYSWLTSWILGTGTVKEENLTNDVREINKYYLTNGYVDVRVAEPKVEEHEDGLKVVFSIDEGEQYTYDKITASGDLLAESVKGTLEGIESKSGEIFNVELLRKDTFLVSEKFTNIGFAFANVDPTTNVNRAKRTVDVNFVVDKGELIEVSRINISGNRKTLDNVIRRSLQIGEQELFSSSKIKRSQELLQRLGYFDEVTITPEPAGDKNKVDLNVAVREGNTGTFSAGAGVSSGDGFIVSSRISENNLFGTGNSLTLDVNTGSQRENLVISFNNPRVNDTRWSLGFDLLSTKREFDDFDRDQAGGSITAGYPLWFLGPEYLDDVRFSLAYELVNVDIKDVDDDAPQLIVDQEGKTTSSSVTPQLVRNTIDNPLDPSSGSRQTVSFETAGLGGDQKFWLGQASNSFYVPLVKGSFGNLVFAQRTRIGYGKAFDGEPFPLFKRFFPGGINSVRGFDSRELGPKDEEGNEFGGNKQLVGNFELIFPLVPSVGISGVTFYDIGNAFDDEDPIDFADLRQAIGWGIRWRSPIAPIRVEFGYPLDKEEGDKSFVTNFSFGNPN